MGRRTVSRLALTLFLTGFFTLAFNVSVRPATAASSTPYTDFHDLLNASSSNLQAIIGFAYELYDEPGHTPSIGELNPYIVDPWWDNNNFVPANGRLLISVHDISPLSEQDLTVEFDTGSLAKIYVPATDGTAYWLYLWVADDGSTYYDREMTHLARTALIPATVDIKPDTLNLRSKGKWIKAYIELPEGHNVNDIDILTVRLNGEVQAKLHPTKVGDYDGDGVPDLMVKFGKREVIPLLSAGENTLTVTGEVSGEIFEGSATITAI